MPPPHTYTVPGTYNVVILTVTDEHGAVGSKTLVITVTESGDTQPPQVSIISMPGTVQAGTAFTLRPRRTTRPPAIRHRQRGLQSGRRPDLERHGGQRRRL